MTDQPADDPTDVNYTDEITPEAKMLSFVSLYSGCGGMDLGFRDAGFRPIWSNDIDPVAVETYKTVLPGHTATAGDIATIQDLPGFGDADLVIGGPPCQGFSVAGRMDPNDPRSRHVHTFMDVVARICPKAFVMENVKALAVNSRWGQIREHLQERASALGFSTDLFLLNASHFGVPQARERMFLIGIQRELGSPTAPTPSTKQAPPTLRSALETLPPYGHEGNDSVCAAKITLAKAPVLRRSPWAGMLFNGAGRPMDLDRPAPTLPASMGGNKTPIIDQDQLTNDAKSWVESYHDHLWSGGKPRRRVPSTLRRITVQEAAAIQTFPNDMAFSGSQSAHYRQIGNAVPPRLAFHVALAVRNSLCNDLPPHPDDKESV